jgi:hypothetical protein
VSCLRTAIHSSATPGTEEKEALALFLAVGYAIALLLLVVPPEDELGMSAGKVTTPATAIVEPADKAAARKNLFMKYPSDGVDGHD